MQCCPASPDTFLFSHCAAHAVFCAILRDVIRHGFFLFFRLFQVLGTHVRMNVHSFQIVQIALCYYVFRVEIEDEGIEQFKISSFLYPFCDFCSFSSV